MLLSTSATRPATSSAMYLSTGCCIAESMFCGVLTAFPDWPLKPTYVKSLPNPVEDVLAECSIWMSL